MTTTLGTDRLSQLDAKLDRLATQVDYLAEQARRESSRRETASELISDLSPIATQAMSTVTNRLAELEELGYFGFAREGLGVLDRIVTTYDEDDIRALGDNIGLILDTVKQMTQPEVMTMLRRTVHSMEKADVEALSLIKLARQMRDPEVKRGLARLLGMLRTMGSQEPTQTNTP